MESTLRDLRERRSIRSFKPEQISDRELELILESGSYAPTGKGRQSPIMVAVQDPQTIARLSKMNAEILGSKGDPFFGAPTVIIVLADRSVSTHVEDGSLVMGNLMNAAYALGVGSCWIHRAKQEFDSDAGKALLREWGIEGDYEGIGHCILGYPAGEHPVADARKENYITIVK